ncbi:hypothetical protein [Haloquadratum walsbyi]|uniref:hypothetical protein n=1 Tax=Haloquadratum walsbyi TaxID=293091 RepID=UPI000B315AB9|nr:hypothetical protein [Haloquadratum walsbyi]
MFDERERERLEREQRALSRKECESNNWENQRRTTARRGDSYSDVEQEARPQAQARALLHH